MSAAQAAIPLYSTGPMPEADEAAIVTLRSGQIASGANVEAFRSALADTIDNPAVVTTSDMSMAITIALRLAGVGPGHEVIASPFACLSTNAPIALSGARLRWADVDPATGAIDVGDVRRLIGPATKAVVVYHLAGYPGPARELAALCQEAGIALIEDCDNALGATRDGRPVGSDGDHAIYSFYPNRQVNGIEGGAIASRNPADTARAARLRRFGIDPVRFRAANGEIADDADVTEIGWSGSMSNLNAAVAKAQIAALPNRLAGTRANARQLEQRLADIPGITPFAALPGADPVYWGLMVRAAQRDTLLMRLKEAGVLASLLHQRNDRYSGMPAERRTLPGVDEIERDVLAIPCGWWLKPADLDRIEEAVATALR
ncbi:DegT/DnrJ/EryC1/StrS family aminotransferase [Sphingomonas dokdonensis]|uniref:UDP-4-amino-4-deoxy-L-arabinose--oxoglutarate aminotransferase n=1 Tax=Sphingomonas dokdonensis TaxID=344880 RepID=A0A2D0A4L8_9SPHN|nr:DegT/DnrJ/EryC1/StrS family aminotransferase [Sphingomonas dokdonensis]OWK27832.1 UDP-4-amino-4-deoxy-L-arabinose--oxoglutarate aminotransferase [Sphingomonas dokdonensis]